MTHTPGPWQARGGRVRLDDPPVWEIFNCEVTAPLASVIATVWGAGECEAADAHLIAAAPEMLEVLEWLMEEFDRRELDGNAVFCGSDMSQVRLVVKKARGEA